MSRLYLFTTSACSKCPEAHQLVTDLDIDCEILVADKSQKNMDLANKFGISSVPTFIEEFDNGEFTIHSKGAVRNLREQWKKK